MTAERLGIPAVGIMTEKFVSAAELMARVLGADGYPFVTIPHPISSATETELSQAARTAAAECVELLATSSQQEGESP